jgi:NAD+ kinase
VSDNPAIRRALVIYKTSPYDRYDELGVLDTSSGAEAASATGRAQILARLESAHLQNQRAIRLVQEALSRSGLEVTERQQPTKREAAGVDLVISVGGDGTFLATAQRVENALMLGVNSAPDTSVGHYCATHASGFEEALSAILRGDATIQPLNRIACRVGDRALPYQALNDVLFAHRTPASSTRYLLDVDDDEELQTSSGIWISTASGASGAMRSAGGQPMVVGESRLQYRVREPYARLGSEVRLRGGLTDHPISVIARSPKLQVFLDGHLRTQSVGFGTRVTFSVAPSPLRVVGYRHLPVEAP